MVLKIIWYFHKNRQHPNKQDIVKKQLYKKKKEKFGWFKNDNDIKCRPLLPLEISYNMK